MMRRLIVWLGLTWTYFFVVTPIAGMARLMGRPLLPMSPNARMTSYWVTNTVDSRAREIYVERGSEVTSPRRATPWMVVLQAYRRVAAGTSIPWKWLLLVALLPWARLVVPQEERELRSDLYILF